MRILLHIGTDKAGSTAIQQHLYLNREWLADRQVYLPSEGFGENNGHAALFESENPAALERLQEELLAARAARHHLAILSWEGLSLFSRSRIRQLLSYLAPADYSVLVYLREQADIVQSGYLQQVKSLTHPLSLSAFESPRGMTQRLRSYRARKHPSRNYLRMLQRWEDSVGDADVVVRIFDREFLHQGDVVDDFVMQLGLEIDRSFEKLSRPINDSLDVETATLVNQWQQQGVGVEQIAHRIDAALSLISHTGGGSRYFLSEKAVEKIRGHYRRSNQLLARRYLSDSIHTFQIQKDCWKQIDDAAFEKAVELKEEKILALAEIPVHRGPLLLGPAFEPAVSLLTGWQMAEPWGRWSEGDESRLRMRIPFQQLLSTHTDLRLFIKGRYFGNNKTTRVSLNGEDLGEHCLNHKHTGLLFPVKKLLPHEMLEIVLSHAYPISPRQYENVDDDRELAFGMEAIGYDLLSEIG